MIQSYMQRIQRILGDKAMERFNPYDLLAYVNEARGIVAAQGECVRVLCPSTAGVNSIFLLSGGTGYSVAPPITLSAPGTPNGITATAVSFVAGGVVMAIQLTNTGSGYLTPPSVTIGGAGVGATATSTLGPLTQCIAGQEVYNHADFNTLIVSAGVGATSIIAIRNIAVSWGSMKPMLRYMAWGDFQAYLRAYNVAAQGYPRVWSPYRQGVLGSFYLWPIPSSTSQMDLDCICLPQDLDLNSDATAEAIPYPFTNAIPYKAAQLAVMGEPDLRELAPRYEMHFEKRMQFASATAAPTRVPDYYAAGARL